MSKRLGIIGGSGLYEIPDVEILESHKLDTPWGTPSAPVVECEHKEQRFFFLPRHGIGHSIPPSKINYRANIDAFKKLGVTDILSLSSVGSLNEDLSPGVFVIINQYVDFTKNRITTFFDDDIVVHVSMATPTDDGLMEISRACLEKLDIKYNFGGSYICIEGPQFSTKEESRLFQKWGCDVIGMTSMPEAKLCREASLRYVNIGMVTDFDCWHPDHENVEVSNVISTLKGNTEYAKKFILEFLLDYSKSTIKNKLNSYDSLVTAKNKLKKETVYKFKNIMPDLHKDFTKNN